MKTQLQVIAEVLERDGRIDNFRAIHDRISLRLGARIWDLRHAGYQIDTEELPDKNTVYHLVAKPAAEADCNERMNAVESAIKEAVEKGGFMPFASIVPPSPWISEKIDFDTLAIYDGDPELSARRGSIGISRTLINPLFWQALGKARGWGSFYDEEGSPRIWGTSGYYPETGDKATGADEMMWKAHWHRFIDHLAEGNDAESFFAALTSGS